MPSKLVSELFLLLLTNTSIQGSESTKEPLLSFEDCRPKRSHCVSTVNCIPKTAIAFARPSKWTGKSFQSFLSFAWFLRKFILSSQFFHFQVLIRYKAVMMYLNEVNYKRLNRGYKCMRLLENNSLPLVFPAPSSSSRPSVFSDAFVLIMSDSWALKIDQNFE